MYLNSRLPDEVSSAYYHQVAAVAAVAAARGTNLVLCWRRLVVERRIISVTREV